MCSQLLSYRPLPVQAPPKTINPHLQAYCPPYHVLVALEVAHLQAHWAGFWGGRRGRSRWGRAVVNPPAGIGAGICRGKEGIYLHLQDATRIQCHPARRGRMGRRGASSISDYRYPLLSVTNLFSDGKYLPITPAMACEISREA